MLTQLTPYVSSSGDGLYHINLRDINVNEGKLEQILDFIGNDAEKNHTLGRLRIFVSNTELINPLSNLVDDIWVRAKFNYEEREDAGDSGFADFLRMGSIAGGGACGSFLGARWLFEEGKEIANYISDLAPNLSLLSYGIPPVTGLSGLVAGFIVGALVSCLAVDGIREGIVVLQTPDAPRLRKYQAISGALFDLRTENYKSKTT